MTPDVKKEDQECFEDDKVKEEPTEPHKSEQGRDQKDEQEEETEKLHLKNIRNDVLLYMLTAKSKKVNKYKVEGLNYKFDLQNPIAFGKMLKRQNRLSSSSKHLKGRLDTPVGDKKCV